MRLLLDTHIATWAVARTAFLSRTAIELIENAENDVAVSVVSLWEIVIKNNLGRPANDPFSLTFSQSCIGFAQAGFSVLPIEQRHLAAVEDLPRHNRDPFDRLLIATALADTYRFVTHDRALAAYGDQVMLV